MADDEQITPYDGPTDLDMLGNRQPLAAGAGGREPGGARR
jgi:hypothetical protein